MTKTLVLLLALTTAIPAFAGGPVITEDAYTTEAPRDDRKIPAWVFLALGAVVVAAIAGGGGDVCNGPVDPVPPTNGGC